jgi:murein DD-endopeptidase MepM/ murein hydrolase activator NlpD
MATKGRSVLIIFAILLLIVAGAVVFFWPYLEGQEPQITVNPAPTNLGRQNALELKVTDQGLGLAWVKVTLIQQGKEKVVLQKDFPTPRMEKGGQTEFSQKLVVEPLKLGLAQGEATFVVEARDRSFSNFLHGNLARLEYASNIDTVPPRIGVQSRNIYLNRGGTAMVIYQVSPDANEHGVSVGGQSFRGYKPWPDKPDYAACYFAFADDMKKNAPIIAWARDPAGNQAKASLNVHLRWKRYRQDKINLSDRLIKALAPRFMAQAPPNLKGDVAVFLWVNSKLREINHQKIQSVCAQSQPKELWQKTFLRPMGKPMSGFGDRRTYFYNDKEVSKAVHRGVDLADVANSPIPAVAAGKVLFSAMLGIYGNCVILDHGMGVHSLYGHLSTLDVQPGQEVKRGQKLGASGATGLALGDHLHFSVVVGGVFVNPAEWWDPHWIADNLTLRYSEAGLKRP